MTKANVYFFNPTCELAVANGSFSYMPPLLLQEMERDLSVLPFVFANEYDFVLTKKPPSSEFCEKLKEVGFAVPGFCSLDELISGKSDSFGSVFPWGWSPSSHFFLKELKKKCSEEFQESPVSNWSEAHRALFERNTSLEFLTGFLNQNPKEFYIGQEMAGKKVTTLSEIEIFLKKHSAAVLKAPLSSSGRGIQFIRKAMLNTSNRQWISGILNKQGYLVAEPVLDKIADLSFQFRISNRPEPEYLGYSVFETNVNGQYKSTMINPRSHNSRYCAILHETNELINSTAEQLTKALSDSVYLRLHRGFLGIDALIYSDKGSLKIQPCVEINSRMNMGILTFFLEKKIYREAVGKFELFYGKPGEFGNLEKLQSKANPLKYKGGKLLSGFLSLVEPGLQSKFGAYIYLSPVK